MVHAFTRGDFGGDGGEQPVRSLDENTLTFALAANRARGFGQRCDHLRRATARFGTGPDSGGMCGGLAGLPCPGGFACVEDPSDSCDSGIIGGADCSGVCLPIDDYNPCAAILCVEGTTCCPQCGGICIPDDNACSEELCYSEPCNQTMCGPG